MNQGVFEAQLSEALAHVAIDSKVFFDIGANEGYFSIITKKSNPDLSVYAFEPQGRLQEVIKKNCELNKCEINLYNYALSNSITDKKIFLGSSMNNGSSSLTRNPTKWGVKTETIKSITLDSFIESNKIEIIDFAKIDIEGHEYELLQGATNALSRKVIKVLFLDIHTGIIGEKKENEIVSNLKNFGYRKDKICNSQCFIA